MRREAPRPAQPAPTSWSDLKGEDSSKRGAVETGYSKNI